MAASTDFSAWGQAWASTKKEEDLALPHTLPLLLTATSPPVLPSLFTYIVILVRSVFEIIIIMAM